ncbi:serine hydrolase [Priestia megaterium]|jgi:CubicO group peptidase (beta-lactamase class C family)|uniref:serine hydrolase n=1 Tax=Priestia megaterium TaxID=1404 RepID=UPI0021C1BF4E|nr:serine hydrolase [Priestia megaterium]MCT9852766.1 serine hydrolase [Priestia megaterium]MDF1960838.1 serine hydrolase [Priestia megaterium]
MQKIKSSLTGRLRGYTKEMMRDLNVPGAAVAIIKDGEIILSEGFGYRDIENKKPVTPSTLFAIGSSTKAFGTLSLSLLAQQQKFNWDKSVQTYIPTFSLYDPLVSSQTTARDLASHRSGVSRHELLWYGSSLTRKEIVGKIQYLELDAPFRTTFLYNNLMYATISYMVEEITNQTWEQYVTEHILQPLHMEDTNFSVTTSQEKDDHALPYIEKNKDIVKVPFRNIDAVGAAGCINSNIEDMAKWVLFHLNQGKVGKHELITPDMLQQMYQPHIPIPDNPLLSTSETTLNCYGLGWFISAYRGYKVIHHGGNIDGFSALVSFIPEENIGLVILTNTGTTLLPSYLADQIYDELLGLDAIDWHKRAIEDTAKFKEMMKELDKPLPQVKETALTHAVEDYTGIFEHPAYGKIEVYKQNDTLYLKWESVNIEMKHHHYNVYTTKWNLSHTEMNVLIAYEMDVEGNLSQFKLHLPPMLSTKPIVFSKLTDRIS